MLNYDKIRLLDITAQAPCDIDVRDATHVRFTLPSDAQSAVEMARRGYVFGDRTVGVSINLSRLDPALEKQCRLPVVQRSDRKQDMLRIACESFPYDRRFHIMPTLDAQIARAVLADWIEAIPSAFIAEYKGETAGFLALTEAEEGAQFVSLAATDARYRLLGTAMSLYVHAALWSKENGSKKLLGRVSTQNTSVMNLYARLGASFQDPQDIFLKEVYPVAGKPV